MIVDANGKAYTKITGAAYRKRQQRLLASAREQDFKEGYRSQGGHPLIWLNQDEIIRRAYLAFMLSPLGGGLVEKPVDIIIGNGFEFKSDDERVQEALNDFWKHPVNNFPWNQDRRAEELSLFGEQCYSVHTHPNSGDVLIGNIHPYIIERTIVDPVCLDMVIGVKLKNTTDEILRTAVPAGYTEEQVYSEKAREMRATFTAGECFFFAVNERTIVNGEQYDQLGPSLRGTSDLLAALDWIFASDDYLSSMLERADIASRILWDVSCEGMGQEEIDEFIANTPIPDKNTVNAHNERIKWELQTPDLGASEHETGFRLIRNFTISGKGGGFPGHWFGDGGDVNRATAAEMYFPTLKHLNRRQWKIMEMFRQLLAYQLDQKGLPHDEFEMVAPTISEKDMDKMTNVLSKLSSSLLVAEDRQWLTREEARQVYRSAIKDLGSELADEYEAEAEDEARMTEDYRKLQGLP